MEYRLRYRRPSVLFLILFSHSVIRRGPSLHPNLTLKASQWEELLLKANEKDPEQGAMLFDHVHQLHGLASGMEHELTIESKNKFGWSRPLEVDFTTLPQGNEICLFICRLKILLELTLLSSLSNFSNTLLGKFIFQRRKQLDSNRFLFYSQSYLARIFSKQ